MIAACINPNKTTPTTPVNAPAARSEMSEGDEFKSLVSGNAVLPTGLTHAFSGAPRGEPLAMRAA
jgi:hypothetical protein